MEIQQGLLDSILDEYTDFIWSDDMHLVDCTEEYWNFVRTLRNDPRVQDGFIEKVNISLDQQKGYMKKYSPNWDIIPTDIKIKIKAKEKEYRDSCLVREMKPKHKYIYILGQSKKETKALKKLFKNLNPKLVDLPYPTDRGT